MGYFCLLISLLILGNNAIAKAIDIYKQGLSAIKQKNWQAYYDYQENLNQNAFGPLLRYQYLRHTFQERQPSELLIFIEKHPKSPMSVWLKRKYLDKMYNENDYETYLNHYSDVNLDKNHCQYISVLYKTGNIQKAQSLAQSKLQTAKAIPEICEQTFRTYLFNHDQPQQALWQRYELALLKYKFKLADKLQTLMKQDQLKDAEAIRRLFKNHNLVLRESFVDLYGTAEVLSYGLYRLARRQPAKAAELLNKFTAIQKWTPKQINRVNQAIALRYTLRKSKLATKYYNKLIGAKLPKVYETYMFKAALYNKDWQLLRDAIDAFPQDKKQKSRYQYWYARALSNLDNQVEANKIFEKLASQRNYYGFLSSYKLKQDTQVNHATIKFTEQEMASVTNLPGYVRAKTFFDNGKKHNARLELFYLMKNLDEKSKYMVVIKVGDWGWQSQALRLSSKLAHQDDLNMRFPVKYRQLIKDHAKKHAIPEPLVYAIIRQESLFTENIKSHAGAVGLMQLLPTTAYSTAKRYRIPYGGASSLTNPKTNIKIGIAHLNMLNKQLNKHPLKIIAAYNAGKKAVNRWQPPKGKKIAGEIWIELVPYRETRRYLRHVVANYVVYQHQLGKDKTLHHILKPVR